MLDLHSQKLTNTKMIFFKIKHEEELRKTKQRLLTHDLMNKMNKQ